MLSASTATLRATDATTPARSPGPHAQRVGRAAIAALYDELALAPKPGLVSFADSGSHSDMDAAMFMRSLFALRHYFVHVSTLGAARAPFAQLEAAGMQAEARMLLATGGVNTHRGAVFTLGLLAAAAGLAGRPVPAARLRRLLQVNWGHALQTRRAPSKTSHGRNVVRAFGLRGANEEAALGFPAVFELAWPAWLAARRAGMDSGRARLQTLMTVISELDDTNLVHRGGLEGLRFAQCQARAFLRAGGATRPDAVHQAGVMHASFVRRRLSPGGAADVLAAVCFLSRVCRDA